MKSRSGFAAKTKIDIVLGNLWRSIVNLQLGRNQSCLGKFLKNRTEISAKTKNETVLKHIWNRTIIFVREERNGDRSCTEKFFFRKRKSEKKMLDFE